ncbi:uncharacterized protein LOC121734895 [Aricia agestis]|uniref:uncharacterized protein LOC121734895 n=1 Tax=Aricia agestis TaxID=91739 RepID=UPI001C20575C|nr:uncharacterized protein LOC121734895 [Aricia agestis]
MCSTNSRGFYCIVHWTLLLVGLAKLILDTPCWYFVVSEQYKLIFPDDYHKDLDSTRLLEKRSVSTKLFIGMHLAILKFVIDVFMDLTLLYACYKKNKGLLVLYSTYNAAVAALTIAGIWRAFRDFSKATATSAVNPFSSGPKDSVLVEVYLMFVFIAPYIVSSVGSLMNNALAIFITEMVMVHIVLPILVYYEIQMVKIYQLQNRAILMHLLKDKAGKEETAPMNAQNSDV